MEDLVEGVLADVYRGRSVLVTGHTGFKGSWLALWLASLGARVTGLALPPETRPNHFDLVGLPELVDHRVGDVRSWEDVISAFRAARPEVVLHLAAQALVRRSYREPKETFDTNVGGVVNVLEAVRTVGTVKACIVATSDKCYENREWVWGYRENDPLGGADPYSASKGAAEIVAQAYMRSFFSPGAAGPNLGLATVRAGNVIGGGDWSPDRLVPDCVRALCAGRPIRLRNPRATRPWQHVLEPLGAYLALGGRLLADPARFSGAWNFGPSERECLAVGDLASLLAEAWGGGEVVYGDPDHDLPEAARLRLNCDKARVLLGWSPTWSAAEAVERTVAWYRHWREGEVHMRSVSLEQIARFTADAGRGS